METLHTSSLEDTPGWKAMFLLQSHYACTLQYANYDPREAEAHESTSLEVCIVTPFGCHDRVPIASSIVRTCCLPDLYNFLICSKHLLENLRIIPCPFCSNETIAEGARSTLPQAF